MKTRTLLITQPTIETWKEWNEKAGDTNQELKIEIEAAFPGGSKAWVQFLQENINPDAYETGTPPGTYRVVARFIIDKYGSVSDVVTETRHGYGMEEEVIQVLKRSPKWIPAHQNGRSVNAYRRQPVTFVIVD